LPAYWRKLLVMHLIRRDSCSSADGIACRLVDVFTLAPGALSVRGLALLTAVLTTLAACSTGAQRESQHTVEDARQSAHQGATTSDKRVEVTLAPEGETTTAEARVGWDYVALGDSLAAGVGAHRGYVARYAEHLRSDTGAHLRVINLGQSGQTSSQLLHALRNDPAMRESLRGAEVVTLNIGLNDLGQASSSYESGTCGGPRNEACLREAVKRVEHNWDAIIEEISSLRSTDQTIIRTTGLGYTPRTRGVLRRYLGEVTRDIAAATAEGSIPYAEARLGGAGMSGDGLHPNDRGYQEIADRLRDLGYEPLDPR
jgi:lysophospholipase L1-like esterase